ncbi:hypothetical protein TNCV_5058161 [Trichonephila clavipes]|nr:hypothetical protein TNCV_5058161 [Trichonephila clavipes]
MFREASLIIFLKERCFPTGEKQSSKIIHKLKNEVRFQRRRNAGMHGKSKREREQKQIGVSKLTVLSSMNAHRASHVEGIMSLQMVSGWCSMFRVTKNGEDEIQSDYLSTSTA